MPQHPQYSNSPIRNVDKMYALLFEMEKFGFIHEELHQVIDELMEELHPDAYKKFVANEMKHRNSDEYEDDPVFLSGAYELFEFVAEDKKVQFVQDLRNVIAHCIDSWDVDGVADKIRNQRDPEYYKMHVYLEEDTDTKKKYENCERTVWFPSNVTPSRPGIYEISDKDYQSFEYCRYAYWDGSKWFDSKILLKDCIDQKRTKENEKSYGSYCWRGFLEQQSN